MKRSDVHAVSALCVAGCVALSWFAMVFVPAPAVAGAYKCDSSSLYEDDEDRLRDAAEEVLPKSAHISTVAPCRYLTSAHAWVETRKTTTTEGVQQWWQMTCWRDALKWRCDLPEFKQFMEINLELDGQSRRIELSFGKGTTLEGAHALASRAVAIYSDPASAVVSCGVKEPKEADRLAWKNIHSSLPTGANPIHVSVTHNAESESAWLDDVGVEIEFPAKPDDAASSGTVCWLEEIIVA